jgi:hypothetical protein
MRKVILHLLFLVLFLDLAIAQGDFDFKFYPSHDYWHINGEDTTGLHLENFVVKEGDLLKVVSTVDMTNVRFERKISFVGVSLGADLLTYSASGCRIYCNPIWGYLLIVHDDGSAEVYGNKIVDFSFIQSLDKARRSSGQHR